MRGRKPTPTVLRMLRGNPGHRPLNPNEPIPDELPTEFPEELTDEDAKREWTRTIVPAIERGQITTADRTFAIAHCELWATWRSQLISAAKFPHVVSIGKDQRPAGNPARKMAEKTLFLLLKVDAELGFSPTSRARVTVAPRQSARDKQRERFFGG